LAGRQQITQAIPAKHLGPDTISDRINDFGTILCRIDVHAKWPLSKGSVDHFHDRISYRRNIRILRDDSVKAL
jgi:hypothetical protein